MFKAINLPIATKPLANMMLFQTIYSYLIGATRTVSTTKRITISYYSCPASPGVHFNFPPSDDCIYVSEEVDRVFEYTVSAGDDGFIAQQDQQIPLRTGVDVNPQFENNFRAGLNSSCNHFTEGNHPEVNIHLRRLLLTSGSPFFIP